MDTSSLDRDRLGAIFKVYEVLVSRKNSRGNRDATLYAAGVQFERFINWCDRNGHSNLFHNQVLATEAYAAYTSFLFEQVRLHKLTPTTAAKDQQSVRKMFVELFRDIEFSREVRELRQEPEDKQATSPPSETNQGRSLALATAVFQGFTELVTNNHPFPYRLAMPSYLGWEKNYLWIFPLRDWIRHPSVPGVAESIHRGNIAYDYSNGVMFQREVVLQHTTLRRTNRALRNGAERLANANTNPRDYARVHFAVVAHNSFLMLFISVTAMNLAQATELPWSDNYEVETIRKKFRVVKWRAKGKKCQFEIRAVFLPLFMNFLKLRRYLLASQQCDWLFFTLGVNSKFAPTKVGTGVIQTLFSTFQKFSPGLPVLGVRKWRAAKSDVTIRTEEDVVVGAAVMQNSIATFEKSYMEGSETVQHEEMTRFFSGVTKTILIKKSQLAVTDALVNGRCRSLNDPAPLGAPLGIKPDCEQFEGCLFCDKYGIHPDMEDVKKLLSCRYYLEQISATAGSSEEYKQNYEPIFARLDAILLEVEEIAPDIVAKTKEEVNRGRLTSYWDIKLSLIQMMGVI